MRRRLALLTLLTALGVAALPASALAAEEHLYDPVLSLTGGTGTSTEDPVPDPGASHPPKSFEQPCGTVTDSHGDIYVASSANSSAGAEGRIDVFSPQGEFLLEIPDEYEPCGLAVDSEGVLYVTNMQKEGTYLFQGIFPQPIYGVWRLTPDSYPASATTEYALEKVQFFQQGGGDLCAQPQAVAIDPSDDHLYIGHSCRVEQYDSAAEGSPLIDGEIVVRPPEYSFSVVDVYGENGDIYAPGIAFPDSGKTDRVFVFDGTDSHVKCEIDGIPTEGGGSEPLDLMLGAALAVDQSNGDLYLYNTKQHVVDQFAVAGEECSYVGRLPQKPPTLKGEQNDIAVDAPLEAGEAGYESPNEGYVYVTSGTTTSNSHLFAFEPRVVDPPEVKEQRAGGISETEALLEAQLNPGGLATTYHFEYLTEAAFLANGESFSGSQPATSVPAPEAALEAGGAFVAVSEPISGLEPDTAYRFRLVASNCADPEAIPSECLTLGEGAPGGAGEDASFATYAPPPIQGPCPNEALRSGASALLPDCRAYELVTPPDTNGRIPTMAMLGDSEAHIGFATTLASPDGASLVFGTNSGSLPGIGGGGQQDAYEALRDPAGGWQTDFVGLSGAQATLPRIGGFSPDHQYSSWSAKGDGGTLGGADSFSNYLRVPPGTVRSPNCAPEAEPEGRFEWIGCGTLGFEPRAQGKWISPGGDHVIFEVNTFVGSASLQLEPDCPATGESAVYDRTPGGPTRCVSLLPGDATPATDASYEGTSADGRAVAFTVAGDPNLYVRRDNAETLVVADGKPTFAGLSVDGSRAFYLVGGDAFTPGEIFACNLGEVGCAGEGSHPPIQIGSGGESTLVNVSADGSHVYFVSPVVLSGEEENGWGAKAEAGEQNLYAWDGEEVRFVATGSTLDMTGETALGSGAQGLGRWVSDVLDTAHPAPANDPSRTTPDGTVFLFQSHEDLTAYQSGGHIEVYRYDAEAPTGERLSCISCNPSAAAAVSDARLESGGPPITSQLESLPPVNAAIQIANVTADGQRAFFQSADRLVTADLDGFQDVYEWEAEGVGGCTRPAGCLALISGGRSSEDDYLYGMTPDGHDVFFLSADLLASQDPDGTYSIYDARVDGGFPLPEPPPGECLGEACQPAVTAPDDPTPTSSGFEGSGNVTPGAPKPRCPKGKRRVRRAGKTRCLPRHPKQRAHHREGRGHKRANANRGAAR